MKKLFGFIFVFISYFFFAQKAEKKGLGAGRKRNSHGYRATP